MAAVREYDQSDSPGSVIEREHRDALLKHREWLEDARRVTSCDRDKTVLAIAGGALGVSVTFLEKIIREPTGWMAIILILGWLLEVTAIILILWSLHSSEAAFWLERERVDVMLDGDGKDPGWVNLAQKRTEWQNQWASGAAILGVFLILSVVSIGLVRLAASAPSSTAVAAAK